MNMKPRSKKKMGVNTVNYQNEVEQSLNHLKSLPIFHPINELQWIDKQTSMKLRDQTDM